MLFDAYLSLKSIPDSVVLLVASGYFQIVYEFISALLKFLKSLYTDFGYNCCFCVSLSSFYYCHTFVGVQLWLSDVLVIISQKSDRWVLFSLLLLYSIVISWHAYNCNQQEILIVSLMFATSSKHETMRPLICRRTTIQH